MNRLPMKMNFAAKRLWILLTIVGAVLMFQFYNPSTAEKVKVLNATLSQSFEEEIESLRVVAEKAREGEASSEQLKSQLVRTRQSYKRLEFLLEYFYPEYVEEHINGAPLLHIETFDTNPMVIPSEGLQVLDEMIFAEDWNENIKEIALLSRQLQMQSGFLLADFKSRTLKTEELLNAARLEIIRIVSMSITGFDTPGSLNGLDEVSVSLKSMETYLEPLLQASDKPIHNEVLELLNEGQKQVSNSTFDDFDRLTFIKEVADPLYEKLTKINNYAYPESKGGWNPKSKSIFANDVLDPYFYSQLSAEEDSDELRNLGKKIFYDPLISGNAQMSCATCHNSGKAFSDGEKRSLSSVEGKTVERNAPTLLNAVYADRYFYDLRAFTLEQQAQHVIFNPDEFNTANAEILEKLNDDKEYKTVFKETFGSKKINEEQFASALASYVLSLRSFNSPFDKYVRNEEAKLPDDAKRGFNLFMGKAACGTCHFAPTFSGLVPPNFIKNETEILGILATANDEELDDDLGRINNQIHSEKAWIYERSFKTSTVRNVELTAPYFHNGEFAELQDVMDFYNNGGGAGIGIEVTNQTLAPDSLGLSQNEMNDIIAFMKSLTDTTLNY
ncbi:cytochrome-c peroxidase [Owenweeksia hongkongensis]|uniref:cytochrome-c peroxidase n=1 Tax=Owenweeksia hongkongensis TaxID=253245 RepID=UPI003A8E129B